MGQLGTTETKPVSKLLLGNLAFIAKQRQTCRRVEGIIEYLAYPLRHGPQWRQQGMAQQLGAERLLQLSF